MGRFKLGMVFIACCTLINCGSTPSNKALNAQNTLNRLIIKNGTGTSIFKVVLKDLDTGNTVSCNTILAKLDCSLGFQPIKLQNHQAIVSWVQNGVEYSQLLPNKQKKLGVAQNFKAFVTILNNGKLKLTLD